MKTLVAIIKIGRGKRTVEAPRCTCVRCGGEMGFGRALAGAGLCEGCDRFQENYRVARFTSREEV